MMINTVTKVNVEDSDARVSIVTEGMRTEAHDLMFDQMITDIANDHRNLTYNSMITAVGYNVFHDGKLKYRYILQSMVTI